MEKTVLVPDGCTACPTKMLNAFFYTVGQRVQIFHKAIFPSFNLIRKILDDIFS